MTVAIDTIVVGASGYVGGELLRLIAAHPNFRLAAAISNSRAGTPIGDLIPTLSHYYPRQSFAGIDAALDHVDDDTGLAVFAAAPHGVCGTAIEQILASATEKSLEVHVVDASADFRYASAAEFEAVYQMPHPAPGLLDRFRCAVPEHMPATSTPHVAHPGCFATAVLLAAMPLFADGLAEPDVFVTGITGSTGSGRSPGTGTHHPERHSNLYAYKPLGHRHVPEIEALIRQTTARVVAVNFIPHSGPFARGIYVTLQAKLSRPLPDRDVSDAYRAYYADADFVHVIDTAPRLKDVVASNRSYIGTATNGGNVVVMCAIDNLVKGAAGGAMQWMNRLWSLPEDSGLGAPAPGWT